MSTMQNLDAPHTATESSCGVPSSLPKIRNRLKKASSTRSVHSLQREINRKKNNKALLMAFLWVFLFILHRLYTYTALISGTGETLAILPANKAVGLISGIPSDLSRMEVHISGHLIPNEMESKYAENPLLNVQVQRIYHKNNFIKDVKNISSVWQLQLLSSHSELNETNVSRVFNLINQDVRPSKNVKLRVRLQTVHLNHAIPVLAAITFNPIAENIFVIYGLSALAGLHLTMLCKAMDHTSSATIAALALIGFMGAVRMSPSFWTIVGWVHFESLAMLFAAMMLSGVLTESGITSYLRNYVFKRSKGDPWAAHLLLCLTSVWLSAFCGELAAVMLATPIVAFLSEIMQLDPGFAFISIATYSNLGSGLSPWALELPQQVIRACGNSSWGDFSYHQFYVHLLACSLNVFVAAYAVLRLQIPRSMDQPSNRGAASQLGRKANNMMGELRCKIHNASLLIRSMMAMGLAFFLYAMAFSPKAYSIVLGVIFMLMVVEQSDMLKVMSYVDWSVLLYIATFRVLTHSLTRMGTFHWVSGTVVDLLISVDSKYRLVVAVVVLLWTSALLAAFVGKLLTTKIMADTVMHLMGVGLLELPLTPLLLASVLGASIGSNGSLIGMPTNVLCVEASLRKITAMDYFKLGFPVMLGSLASATAYLICSYGLFSWD